jgi:hypothetical protein
MQKTLFTTLIFALLLLFIFSPFAALAGLMFVLLITTVVVFFNNIFQAVMSSGDADQHSPEESHR